jgi:hypothetical protein
MMKYVYEAKRVTGVIGLGQSAGPAYNTDNMGLNCGGPYKTDLKIGAVSCFVAGKEVTCASNAQNAAPAAQTAAPAPKGQRHARH